MISHAKCDCSVLSEEVISANFASWSDLKQMLNNTNPHLLVTNNSYVNLHPTEPIILTNEIDVYNLVMEGHFGIESLQVNIMGLDGLEVTSWSNQSSYSSSWSLTIHNSPIEFHVNGTKESDLECSKDLLLPFYSPQYSDKKPLAISNRNTFGDNTFEYKFS
jgi:hypothetical protein